MKRPLNNKSNSDPDKSHDQVAAYEFMSEIINHLPLAMFCKDYTDGKGTIVAWNSFAESLFGLKKDQAIGKTDYDFFPREQCDLFKQKDLETIRTNQLSFVQEETVDSPNLGPRLVRTWKVPIKGRYLLGISQDLTEVKALEGQLEHQKALAFHTAKLASLGEMAGGIAHEINNPLAIISGLIDKMNLLYQKEKLTKDESTRISGNIQKTIQRIKHIVDGLRNLTRNNSVDHKKNADIQPIIQESLAFCHEKFSHLGIDLQFSSKLFDSTMILCDSIQISQVLMNLLNNSATAIMSTNSPWIKVELSRLNNRTILTVTDSGKGIPTNIREKLFQPFFTTKDVGEGAGLGLSISKGIIESHGGKLYLDEQCKNTRFIIELPIAVDLEKVA